MATLNVMKTWSSRKKGAVVILSISLTYWIIMLWHWLGSDYALPFYAIVGGNAVFLMYVVVSKRTPRFTEFLDRWSDDDGSEQS